MTWDAYHRRSQIIRALTAEADRRRDGVLPWGESESAVFDSREDLLLTLHMRWNTRLRAHIDRELDEHPADLPGAAARAWRNAAADLAGARAILDAHESDAALAGANAKELALLASTAGLAAADDTTAPLLGRQIKTRGQSIRIDKQSPLRRQPRLFKRVRNALAA